MSRQPRSQGQPAAAPTTIRQNEYFVPRDGIDREVISADICRYLGNDALVRPGQYENVQTGQMVQGYYITAYRNLTTAMIEDLKADSSRWDSERRAQTARNTGAQYRYSETHQSRQNHGPTEPPYSQDHPYARDSYDGGPRYPGTGAAGYNGASVPYQQQQQQQPPPQGYNPNSGGGGYGGYQQPQQHAHADSRYASAQGAHAMNQGYQGSQDTPYVSTGANMPPRNFSNDPYVGSRMGGTPVSAPQQPIYATTAPSQPGYPSPAAYQQYSTQGAPPNAQSYPTAQQPPQHDAYYRGSPANQASPQQGYQPPGQQYDETPHSRTSATPSASSQTAPSGTTQRRNDRDGDRHSAERHTRPPPRR